MKSPYLVIKVLEKLKNHINKAKNIWNKEKINLEEQKNYYI